MLCTKKLIVLISFLAAHLILTGCGQMGPLYLPNQRPPITVPKPKTNPNAKVVVPSQAENKIDAETRSELDDI